MLIMSFSLLRIKYSYFCLFSKRCWRLR